MDTKLLAMLGCSLGCAGILGIAETAEAQDQPPVATQPPIAGQTNVTTAPGQTIVVVQQNPNQGYAPRRRRRIPAEDGEKPPPGYHTETEGIKGLWAGGISVLAVSYVFTIIGGAVDSAVENSECYNGCPGSALGYYGFIPLVGPWIYVAHEGTGGARGAFAIFGVLQAGGVAMIAAGLGARREIWVSDDAKNTYKPDLLVGPGSIGMRGFF